VLLYPDFYKVYLNVHWNTIYKTLPLHEARHMNADHRPSLWMDLIFPLSSNATFKAVQRDSFTGDTMITNLLNR
jgi:hypothetical protein